MHIFIFHFLKSRALSLNPSSPENIVLVYQISHHLFQGEVFVDLFYNLMYLHYSFPKAEFGRQTLGTYMT